MLLLFVGCWHSCQRLSIRVTLQYFYDNFLTLSGKALLCRTLCDTTCVRFFLPLCHYPQSLEDFCRTLDGVCILLNKYSWLLLGGNCAVLTMSCVYYVTVSASVRWKSVCSCVYGWVFMDGFHDAVSHLHYFNNITTKRFLKNTAYRVKYCLI